VAGGWQMSQGNRKRVPSFLHSALYGSLELAHLLTVLNHQPGPGDRPHPEQRKLRRIVDRLSEDGPRSQAIKLFNRLYGTTQFPLRLRLVRRAGVVTPWPEVSSTPAMMLWWILISRSSPRVAKCVDSDCGRYFFDRTRNRGKKYCSGPCLSRATSRTFRANCGSGSWGARCLSLGDYVTGTGATRGATGAGGC
jgi:CGNR zinc finger